MPSRSHPALYLVHVGYQLHLHIPGGAIGNTFIIELIFMELVMSYSYIYIS